MKQATNISFSLEAAGGPFHDPALLVTPINSSETILLDCGTLDSVRTRNLMKVRWLLLSHLHIDHLIGFDHLLRVRLFSDLPLSIYGPPGTVEVIGHRLQGYAWNLTSGSPFVVHAFDLPTESESEIRSARFVCNDKFVPAPSTEKPKWEGHSLELDSSLTVHWYPVQHGVPCCCYRIDCTFPPQFSLQSCRRLGLQPGPWVSKLTRGNPVSQIVDGKERDEVWLAAHLLESRPLQRLGYLTDTLLDSDLHTRLAVFFGDIDILVSETAYLEAETEAATQNLHMTTTQVARLARDCRAKQLLIFHLSRRHMEKGPDKHLAEVQSHFSKAGLLAEFSRYSSETLS
jgi:ribonuclease Z